MPLPASTRSADKISHQAANEWTWSRADTNRRVFRSSVVCVLEALQRPEVGTRICQGPQDRCSRSSCTEAAPSKTPILWKQLGEESVAGALERHPSPARPSSVPNTLDRDDPMQIMQINVATTLCFCGVKTRKKGDSWDERQRDGLRACLDECICQAVSRARQSLDRFVLFGMSLGP